MAKECSKSCPEGIVRDGSPHSKRMIPRSNSVRELNKAAQISYCLDRDVDVKALNVSNVEKHCCYQCN